MSIQNCRQRQFLTLSISVIEKSNYFLAVHITLVGVICSAAVNLVLLLAVDADDLQQMTFISADFPRKPLHSSGSFIDAIAS